MRTTKITAPDGSVTKIQTTTACGGCFTVLCVLAVLGIPAASFGSWAIPAYLGVVACIVVGLVILAVIGWRSGRNMHGTPLDGPEKDAAYWAAYVARVSGNPQPPPV